MMTLQNMKRDESSTSSQTKKTKPTSTPAKSKTSRTWKGKNLLTGEAVVRVEELERGEPLITPDMRNIRYEQADGKMLIIRDGVQVGSFVPADLRPKQNTNNLGNS